jgi:hypothetical protein
MNDNEALLIVKEIKKADTPVIYLEAIAHLVEANMLNELPNSLKTMIIGLIGANIISPIGEILISEETIWNLFEN